MNSISYRIKNSFLFSLLSFWSVFFAGIILGGLFFNQRVLQTLELNYIKYLLLKFSFVSEIILGKWVKTSLNFLLIWFGLFFLFWFLISYLISRIVKKKFYNTLIKEGFCFLIFFPAILLYEYGKWYFYPFGHYLLIILLSAFFTANFIVFSLKEKSNNFFSFLNKNASKIIWIFIILAFIIFLIFTFNRFEAGEAGIQDLGNMEQAIWSTLHGNFLRNTSGGIIQSRLGIHADIFLVLLAPIYWFWQSPKTLLLLKCLFLSLAAWPLFLLSKKYLRSNLLGLLITFIYLLSPITQAAFLFEFNSDNFLPFFIFLMFYFLFRKKNLLSILFFILALTIKEDVAFLGIFLGVWIYFKENKKIGLFVFLSSVFWFILSLKFIIPYFNQGNSSMFFKEYFSWAGGTPKNLFITLLTKPLLGLSQILQQTKIAYLFYLFLPLLFIPLFSSFILIILPFLFYYVLSDFEGMWSGGFHYGIKVFSFILLAFVFGFNNFKLWIQKKRPTYSKKIINLILFMIFFNAIFFSWFFYLKQWGLVGGHFSPFIYPDEHDKKSSEVISLIPKDAAVVASNHIGSKISGRKDIYCYPNVRNFPEVFNKNDYFLFETAGAFNIYISPEEYNNDLVKLKKSKNLQIIYDKNGYLLLKRVK